MSTADRIGLLVLLLVLALAVFTGPGCVLTVTNVATGQQYLCSSDLPPTAPCVAILPGGNFPPAKP